MRTQGQSTSSGTASALALTPMPRRRKAGPKDAGRGKRRRSKPPDLDDVLAAASMHGEGNEGLRRARERIVTNVIADRVVAFVRPRTQRAEVGGRVIVIVANVIAIVVCGGRKGRKGGGGEKGEKAFVASLAIPSR